MRYFIVVIIVTLIFGCQARQEKLSELLSASCNVPLSAFMDFIGVPLDERDDFQIFYHNFIEDLRTISLPEKRKLRKKEIKQAAMNTLEVRYPQYAHDLARFLDKKHPLYGNAQTFLMRLAAFEQYRDRYMTVRTSTWVKVRGFFNQTKEIVSGWFSSWTRTS